MCIYLQGKDRGAEPIQTNLRVRWSALAPPMQPWHQRMTCKRTRKRTRLSRMLMMMAAAAHLLPQGVPPQHPPHHPPPPVSQARLSSVLVERALNGESPAGLASGDELVQGRPESEAEDNVQAVENAEKRLQEKKSAPKKKDAPSKRPREERRTEERKAVSDTESEDPGPQKKRIPKKTKPKPEPQVVDDSDDSEGPPRASSSRHKPVTSSAIYNAYDGAILNDVRRRFQTLIYVRDGSPVKTLTIHRHLNYRLTLKSAKDTMETVLYRQFKNAMEIAYKDTSKE